MPTHEEIGQRILARPWLLLRMILGRYICSPIYVGFRYFSLWMMGMRIVSNFGVMFSRDLGYGVKVGEDRIQWYDDVASAAVALAYHVDVWAHAAKDSEE